MLENEEKCLQVCKEEVEAWERRVAFLKSVEEDYDEGLVSS